MSELVKMLRETALIKIAKMDRHLKEKLICEGKEKNWHEELDYYMKKQVARDK